MKRTSTLWLIPALLLVASCGDDAAPGPSDEDGSIVQPDGNVADVCGNAVAEGDELCDGLDLNGETCTSATHGVMTGGTLSCRVDCTFNVALCTGEDSGTDDEDGGLGGTGG